MARWTSKACCAALVCGVYARAADLPEPEIPPKAASFEPGDVRLLAGPFERAVELDATFLLRLEPDRLLSRYRQEAGLEPKAEPYGGWEARGIAGHSLGHYLSACARMYRATGDEQFRARVDGVVADLAACQKAAGDGFLGAMPNGRRVFHEVSHGDIRSTGFDLNGSWVPWYNLHKLFAGLVDAARYCESAAATDVAAKLGDWAIATTEKLSAAQWQQMLACEHGGMNEALADLYALTGKQAYMDLARRFYHRDVLDALAEGRDELSGKHANTQIPKAIGAARIYELTGDEKFNRIAKYFWQTVVANHTYATGGNSDGEHFGPPGQLDSRLGLNTTETCNAYNMLKLTAALFSHEPRADYAEYAERALWNHILSSRNLESGRVCYFLTLQPGAVRRYVGDLEFTCCNGSGMENPVRTADYIYAHNGDAELWANQFIASEVNWKPADVVIRQETDFPQTPRTRFSFRCGKPRQFAFHLRHPRWIPGPLSITLNGEKLPQTSTPGGYTTLSRTWQDGDVVAVELPLALRTESMPDNPRRIAMFAGPILLAGDLSGGDDEERLPLLVAAGRSPQDWVKPLDAAALTFRTNGVGRPRDVELLPFFRAHGMPATAYWEVVDEGEWESRQAERAAKRKRQAELEERTVDFLQPGEMQPERDHEVEGENTGAGEFNGRKFRHAWDGGWFSCKVAVPSEGAAELVVDYWGGETGDRAFDVRIDDATIATTSLHQDAPNRFWSKSYPLPAELIAGKKNVTVRFQAKPGNWAGGVYGLRVVKSK